MGVMTNSWEALDHKLKPEYNQVGGHEGVGEVAKLGPGVDETDVIKVGKRVGVKWVAGVCGRCEACYQGAESCCPNQKISGYFTPGTFQQYVLAPANYATPIPDGLDSADAAPMLCAGLTTYSALRKSNTQPGDWVVISGAGGGLGHLAVQIAARGMNLRVIAVDAGHKDEFVKKCGAEHFFDVLKLDGTQLAEKVKEVTGGRMAKAVIVCTAANVAYEQGLGLLGFNGTLVCVGIPEHKREPIKSADPAKIVMTQLRIVGSAVGTQWEALQVLDMAARGQIKSSHRIEKLENLTKVFEEMEGGKLQGRVVLDLQ